jgi:transcription initiation factor TFIIIB Brf1 subunit/transcription initiation factor TFIIB
MTYVLECPNCGGVDFTDDDDNNCYTCNDCGCKIPYTEVDQHLNTD